MCAESGGRVYLAKALHGAAAWGSLCRHPTIYCVGCLRKQPLAGSSWLLAILFSHPNASRSIQLEHELEESLGDLLQRDHGKGERHQWKGYHDYKANQNFLRDRYKTDLTYH